MALRAMPPWPAGRRSAESETGRWELPNSKRNSKLLIRWRNVVDTNNRNTKTNGNAVRCRWSPGIKRTEHGGIRSFVQTQCDARLVYATPHTRTPRTHAVTPQWTMLHAHSSGQGHSTHTDRTRDRRDPSGAPHNTPHTHTNRALLRVFHRPFLHAHAGETNHCT